MMKKMFSCERNVQMLVYLLKAHNIKKVIVSPGTTNCNFVYSLMSDDFFELHSSIDERSAAYAACGMAYESGEPVVITCTGATASRNYFPGLTEAYHRKLPVLAVTATQDNSNCGNLSPQYIDRSEQPKETVRLSVHLQNVKDDTDAWDCNVKINRALLELRRNGGGPVHINLSTAYNNRTVDRLPETRVIRRFLRGEALPKIPETAAKIAVTIGAHRAFREEEQQKLDLFCEKTNAVVFCDHSSGYHGKYGVNPSIVAAQPVKSAIFDIDLLIHLGEEHADYYTNAELMRAKEVWRVSPDGEVRDTFRKLTAVFEMSEAEFFASYYENGVVFSDMSYFKECRKEKIEIMQQLPELPFSNLYAASVTMPLLPAGSIVQLGVSNTMRSWTFFDFPEGVSSVANTGCRGIDGTLSALLGMSLASPERLHFCVLGDLTFFYDMNALGNREVGKNLRILLVNNGIGAEFRLYQHRAYQILQDDIRPYVAAGGHYGNRSPGLVKDYATDLGFEYLCASNQGELAQALPVFTDPEMREKPVLLELFTDAKAESDALYAIRNIRKDPHAESKKAVKKLAGAVLGENGFRLLKKVLKK